MMEAPETEEPSPARGPAGVRPPDRRRRSRGEVRWNLVDDAPGLEALLAELSDVDAYAIDTEFHRERTYFPRLALVQIAWQGGLSLVDPLAVDVAPLAELLGGDALAVLHAADQDLEVLELACGAKPKAIFDTQVCAGFLGYASPSLASLIEHLIGLRLHKGDQLADWTQRPLSPNQQSYAAGDVAHLLELRELETERLEVLGRFGWAEDECRILLDKDRSVTVPEEAWWKLPHSRQLRGTARATAQEVTAWRERRAMSLDVPVRFVLSDLAVMSIAQRSPANREQLSRTRGIDGRHLGGGAAEELLAAIERGRSLDGSQLRLPPRGAFERLNKPAVSLASAFLGQRAGELELDPAVLATRADVVAFFQDEPTGRLVSGWRYELVGAALERLRRGEAALAFDGLGSLVLEERSHRAI